nr:ABC transporter ATP-binding protein [Bifidobacterium choloepi]
MVLRYIRPQWKLATLIVVLTAVNAVASLLIPTYAADLIDEAAAGGGFSAMATSCLLMAVASLVASGTAIWSGYAVAKLSARVARDMRDDLYAKSLELSAYDFAQFGLASMTTRTMSDINVIQVALSDFNFMMLPVPFMVGTSLVLSFRISARIGWLLTAAMAVVIVLGVVILTAASPLYRRLQKLLDRIGAVLLENLTGVRVVRAFGREADEEARMDRTFADYATTSIRANRMFANLDGLSYLAINLFIALMLFVSGHYIALGEFQIGGLVALSEYAVMCLFFLMMAQMMIAMLPRALECARRVDEVLACTPSIADPDDPVDMAGAAPLADGEVLRFDNVGFRFPDASEDALSAVSFSCSVGKTTAVIGGTGSGKSTVAMLALRFHDATTGHVLLDGVDVKAMRQADLHRHVAYIQQRAWLFSGTVGENLRHRSDAAGLTELRRALDVSQSAPFVGDIASDPSVLARPVALGGSNFSGGQRQRLSIARALVGPSQLVVFDDSFSALDFATDAALRRALKEEMGDKAVLIVAQRVNTIRHADHIVVLSDGRVAGQGTHDELMDHCDVYREIVASQTRE